MTLAVENVHTTTNPRHDTRYRARRHAIVALGEQCRWHAGHAAQVSRLARKLYAALRDEPSIRLSVPRPGPVVEWLEYAALLHDIGYIIDAKKHHRHAERLIREADLPGFTPSEVDVIALVARFHRKKWPGPEHKAFVGLGMADYETIRSLTGILRVADGLDRSHQHIVREIELRRIAGHLEIGVHVALPPDLELWAAEKKSGLLEEVIGVPVHIRPIERTTHTKDR